MSRLQPALLGGAVHRRAVGAAGRQPRQLLLHLDHRRRRARRVPHAAEPCRTPVAAERRRRSSGCSPALFGARACAAVLYLPSTQASGLDAAAHARVARHAGTRPSCRPAMRGRSIERELGGCGVRPRDRLRHHARRSSAIFAMARGAARAWRSSVRSCRHAAGARSPSRVRPCRHHRDRGAAERGARRWPPLERLARRAPARMSDASVYATAAARPRGVLGGVRVASSSGSQPWTQVLDWQPPHARWFVGGKLNVSVNCLDRHVRTARRNKAALIWEGEPGDRRTLTYFDLYREVCQFANVLQVARRRARATASRSTCRSCPELAIAMLACARIGAVHTVVFGGFSAESLRDRINDAQAKAARSRPTAATAAAQIVPLKQMADEALRGHARRSSTSSSSSAPGEPFPVHMQEGRDHWYHRPDAGRGAALRRRSRWTRRTCSTSSTPPARPASRRASSTRPAATSSARYATTKWVFDLQGRRRLLVHGRHRLGHRAQLRRLRAARQRRDGA